ncbi:oligosaccharide flippase family protein, partial [Candidatus Gracilibacteria bacterium]|nr:oligosaccharide flippase family protein [Candidatus Gracilibacteria bacterium]
MDYNQKTDLLQDETLSQKLIKKGFWLYLFSYLIAPAGYIVRLLISNSPEVSVEEVGILYSIISLVSFLNVYNDLGLTESLQYFLPKFWIRKEYNHIKTTIWLSLGAQMLTSLLIVGGLLIGNERLANNYFHSEQARTILQYFCIYFLGINLFQTLQSIFIAFQKTFDYQVIDFVRMRSIVGFTAFCFFSGRQSIERYSLNWLIGLGIGLLLGGVIYFRKYRSPLMQGKFERDRPMLKEYSRYALWAFIGANVGNLFGQIIQQMVIYFLGAEAAGYYANFLSLFLIGNMLFAPIMTLLFPLVSELIEKKDHQKVGILCSFFYSYLSIGILIFSAFMMLFSREITILLFGEKFLASGELLGWFSLF